MKRRNYLLVDEGDKRVCKDIFLSFVGYSEVSNEREVESESSESSLVEYELEMEEEPVVQYDTDENAVM